jgi:hypothetical protein
LIFGYFAAVDGNVDTDDTAYVTKSTRAINDLYENAYSALRQNINLLAQKLEIFLDWPSDPRHDPAINISPSADPINEISILGTSLGAYDFDCGKDMPAFGNDESSRIELTEKDITGKPVKTITLDWNSAKHEVLAMYYCFYVEHQTMKSVREWASGKKPDPTERAKYIGERKLVEDRLSKQLLRFYSFMGLAMNEINQIRVKYRPNGYWCSVPGVREYLGQKCTPLRTAEGTYVTRP